MKHTRRSLFRKLAGGIAAVAGVKVAAKASTPPGRGITPDQMGELFLITGLAKGPANRDEALDILAQRPCPRCPGTGGFCPDCRVPGMQPQLVRQALRQIGCLDDAGCAWCRQHPHRAAMRGGNCTRGNIDPIEHIEITLPRDAWGACVYSQESK